MQTLRILGKKRDDMMWFGLIQQSSSIYVVMNLEGVSNLSFDAWI